MKKLNQKGEGMVSNIIVLLIVGALGYVGYVYLWPMAVKADSGQTTNATPGPLKNTGGSSPAANMVQGAQAAGEVAASGR
jgi:hypothetical protein